MAAVDIYAASGTAMAGPYGTTLPADIDDMNVLDPALTDLGLISEDGLEHAFSVDKTVLRDWSGQAVRVIGTSTEITFKLTFLETNESVVEHYYGAAVSVAGTGSKIDLGQPSDAAYAMVISTEDPSTGRLRVYVLPNVEVAERDDQTVKPDETGFGITYQALYDAVSGTCGWILFDDDLTSSVS